eukprot:scaffold33996_cov19-Prasinocladus_malaysianus.AAC.4
MGCTLSVPQACVPSAAVSLTAALNEDSAQQEPGRLPLHTDANVRRETSLHSNNNPPVIVPEANEKACHICDSGSTGKHLETDCLGASSVDDEVQNLTIDVATPEVHEPKVSAQALLSARPNPHRDIGQAAKESGDHNDPIYEQFCRFDRDKDGLISWKDLHWAVGHLGLVPFGADHEQVTTELMAFLCQASPADSSICFATFKVKTRPYRSLSAVYVGVN